jgi:hypothetical protein
LEPVIGLQGLLLYPGGGVGISTLGEKTDTSTISYIGCTRGQFETQTFDEIIFY